ncbi:MAG TPA: hypothetical protein VLB01_03130, partial [Thermodesulfobacteriota bacterium]|nr:hypothetical protein [Thermodesulfobacteriota bacterium]
YLPTYREYHDPTFLHNFSYTTPVKSYLGLWEGVDPNDGGHQIPSITDNGDGTVRLLLHDTTYTLCPTDKGVSEGIGIIQQDGTLKSDDFTPPVRQTDYQYQLQRPFS